LRPEKLANSAAAWWATREFGANRSGSDQILLRSASMRPENHPQSGMLVNKIARYSANVLNRKAVGLMHTLRQVPFLLNREWSARQIADEARQRLAKMRPDLLELHESLFHDGVEDTDLWAIMTPEEKEGIPNIPIIGIPIHEFNTCIADAPGGNGQFIVFDTCIFKELLDLLSAVPTHGLTAWTACVLQGALRKVSWTESPAFWAETAIREVMEYAPPKPEDGVVYTRFSSLCIGLPFCVMFILAHEFAHQKLNHLAGNLGVLPREVGGIVVDMHKINHAQEFEADAWALNILTRIPLGYFATWLQRIEVMFWYMNSIELFKTECQRISGLTSLPGDHPDLWERARRVSELGADFIERVTQGNLDESLHTSLKGRRDIFEWWKKANRLMIPLLAECYSNDPEGTVRIHNAFRDGSLDVDGYLAEMRAIETKHKITSISYGFRRKMRIVKSRLLG
jgi:hypothetical protein